MTIKELKNILDAYPDDAVVMYRHNYYGCIDAEKTEYAEQQLLSGQIIKTLIIEGSIKEN